jgi:hypothetical protein
MNVEQRKWTKTDGWVADAPGKFTGPCQLLLLFGAPSALKERMLLDDLKKNYPEAHFFGCSTAGEIFGTQVLDDSLVATAVQFNRTEIRGEKVGLESVGSSLEAGERLGQKLADKNLVHVLMLSDGLNVYGSDLVKGITRHLPRDVTTTGGLSGDG